LRETSPYTYQYGEKGKTEVPAKFVLKNNRLQFDIKKYDATSPLIIDPTLEFCSFAGSAAENWGYTATYGPDGSMFGGGIANGEGFPVSTGAADVSYNGGQWDIVIIKLNPTGTNRVYATYIGGYGVEQPHSLIVDPQGNLTLAGRTNSTTGVAANRYPTTGPALGPPGGYDIAITKINAAGSALIGSRTIGGDKNDGVNITDNRASGEQQLV
jgi:hypothetical protein